jgi:kynurenine formamidase
MMALARRHGDVVRPDGGSGANEIITMGGHTGTHIDALSHFSFRGKLHGGVDAVQASTGGRFRVLGVETIQPLFCRGVLLDVPAMLGASALEPGQPITAELLSRTEKHAGVVVAKGDAVLIRTGWPLGRYHDPIAFVGHEHGVPGPNESAALWLVERGVRLTGSDTIAYEWIPAGTGQRFAPVHRILLVEHGINIVEMLDLEMLARLKASEFVFALSPLPIVGATGSPVRALALLP